MAYTQNKALELARSFLKQACTNHPIRFAYLYGSYARGTQKEYSDIDIAVVLAEIAQTGNYVEEAFDIFHEAQEYNSLLEVICLKKDEFENNGGTIVSLIKKEGIRIDFL